MKTIRIVVIIVLAILCLLAVILPRSDTQNANVIISKDYSTITYDGDTYVPIDYSLLPKDLGFGSDNTNWINATVEGENYFLDKYFFTNYIYVKEYNGNKFIELVTDCDVNDSNYYCLPSYKDKHR